MKIMTILPKEWKRRFVPIFHNAGLYTILYLNLFKLEVIFSFFLKKLKMEIKTVVLCF